MVKEPMSGTGIECPSNVAATDETFRKTPRGQSEGARAEWAESLSGCRVGLVKVTPPRHQRHRDFFLQQIAPHDNLEPGQVSIAGESGRVRDAREMNRLPYLGGPSVRLGAVKPRLLVSQEYSHCQST
jgi:hypothetical protein